MLNKLIWWSPEYIGGKENPYLIRWFMIPRNRLFNIYFHKFCRSDDDRALHDHPWASCSIILKGAYIEVTKSKSPLKHYDYARKKSGAISFRRASKAHCIKLFNRQLSNCGELEIPIPVWTLFLTGPKVREWGFHCPKGWRHWRVFTDETGNSIGRGCEQKKKVQL